ncbi:MAG: AzlC family ABC transporter permease [Clostridia bacterium]|nr:AzlC family ABC transporter permease [Clostridia bacterium]
MNLKDLKKAFLLTLPVMMGYIVLGMGFGIVLYTRGYGIWWALAMSVFIYAGSLQYVTVDLLTGGASLITTALTSLMVNARHLFYGISMIDRYKGKGIKRLYTIFALTDETYSLVCGNNDEMFEPEKRKSFYFTVSLLDQIYWITGSVLGSLAGSLIKFDTKGIDFALTALFVTIFVEQWLSTKDHRAAIVGVASSLTCLLIFGSDRFLIPAMIAIGITLCLMKPSERRDENVG